MKKIWNKKPFVVPDIKYFYYYKFYRADDINGLITGKLAIKYAGRDIESMKAIANASSKRSLADFQKVMIILFCFRE